MNTRCPIFSLGIVGVAAMATAFAQSAAPTPAKNATHGPATIKELMTLIVEPTSNGVFRVSSEAPKSDAEWKTLQGQALMLLEVADSLATANRSKGRKQWLADAKAFQDASKTAFDAARIKNVEALSDVSDPLYATCASCHEHYLPKS